MSITSLQFNKLIKADEFFHHLQPIYNIQNGSNYGYEALLRTNICSPSYLFQYARQAKRLFELDTKSLHKIFFDQQNHVVFHNGLLFVNIFPTSLLHPLFPTYLEDLISKTNGPHHQVVFEVNESEKVANLSLLKDRISLIKELGFKVAIDDLGSGWSSLSQLIELRPHFAKLDRYFSTDLSSFDEKQAMIKSLLTYCQLSGIEIILEGIENQADLRVAKELGVKLGQGFLLGVPKAY